MGIIDFINRGEMKKRNIVVILLLVPVLCFAQEPDLNKLAVSRRLQETVKVVQGRAEVGRLQDAFQIRQLINKARENLQSGNIKKASALLDRVRKKLGLWDRSPDEEASGTASGYSATGSRYEKIKIIGAEIKNGRGDPSLEYGPDGVGWLTYTLVDVAGNYLTTHLAKSLDNGKTWKFVKAINEPFADTVGGVEGNWEHETTTIIYDPNDPGKEWKLYWFRYFRTQGSIARQSGHTWLKSWISYKYASNPQGQWSEEIPVFGMGDYREKGVDLAGLHPDLKDLVFFYELGSLYLDGVIYLSLEGCASATGKGEWEKKKIILVSSHDHGKTWIYNGTLIDHNDAKDSGYLTYTASSLVQESGRVFLMASPSGKLSNPQDPEGHHDGTDIFEFEDIIGARLKRDRNGKLILIKHIDDNLLKGGQADYDQQNSYGGIVIPQEDLDYYPEVFQLFSTKQKIVDGVGGKTGSLRK